jgi:hypothetical protein
MWHIYRKRPLTSTDHTALYISQVITLEDTIRTHSVTILANFEYKIWSKSVQRFRFTIWQSIKIIFVNYLEILKYYGDITVHIICVSL